jgi:hypothetical protein
MPVSSSLREERRNSGRAYLSVSRAIGRGVALYDRSVEYDEQTPGEMAAHYSPGGPVSAANDWISLVLSGDLRSAWSRTDETLRLVLVQAWLWANRVHPSVKPFDLEAAAASLSGLTFSHVLWSDFEQTQVDEFRQAWPNFNHEDWGATSRPRPVPPDCEIVLYVRTDGEVLHIEQETLVENPVVVLVRSTSDGWLVRGFSDVPPQPGWPPSASSSNLIE